jgi:hypothetical protein
MPTIKDFLGFVVNPPPGDPTRTAQSDLLPKSAVTVPSPPPTTGYVPASDGSGSFTWQPAGGTGPAGPQGPAGPPGPSWPLVTTLPASPNDADECYYLADATNGIVWHLKYRAASASAYKWEFVGGSEMFAPLTGFITVSSTTPVALTGGPTLTAPRAGDYRLEWLGNSQQQATGQSNMYTTPASNGVVIDSGTAATFVATGQFGGGTVVMTRVATLVAGAVLTLWVWDNTPGMSVSFGPDYLKLRPIRLS